MGLCTSTPEEKYRLTEKKKSKEIDVTLNHDRDDDEKVAKLLLLGPGESGKSTVLKQMTLIYGVGFDDAKRASFIEFIHENVFESIVTLCTYTDKLSEHGIICKLQPDHEQAKQYILNLAAERSREMLEASTGPFTTNKNYSYHLDATGVQYIEQLWSDPGIQLCYEHRTLFQLPDCAAYYFDRIRELGSSKYLPSIDDVLHARVRTTGVIMTTFRMNEMVFKVFDVGGQKSERKKWIHVFDSVTAILYIAAISEYNQMMWENQNKNRLLDAIELFEPVCNAPFFEKTHIILFLNKMDLFEDKLKSVPLSVCFPEIEDMAALMPEESRFGGRKYKYFCMEFLKTKFRSVNKSQVKRIYVHFTCATDTKSCQAVFAAVKDIVIKGSLAQSNLIR